MTRFRRLPITKFCIPLVALALLSAPAGCGSTHSSSVRGSATLDGKPLTRGIVTFHPTSEGPLGYGQIKSNGRYAIKTGLVTGLSPGEYVVTVVSTGPMPPVTDDLVEPVPERITPQRYAQVDVSPLRFTIKPGENVIDLPLSN